jgi:hypothetical protein
MRVRRASFYDGLRISLGVVGTGDDANDFIDRLVVQALKPSTLGQCDCVKTSQEQRSIHTWTYFSCNA